MAESRGYQFHSHRADYALHFWLHTAFDFEPKEFIAELKRRASQYQVMHMDVQLEKGFDQAYRVWVEPRGSGAADTVKTVVAVADQIEKEVKRGLEQQRVLGLLKASE